MDWCLRAPSHYLNQCRLIISKILWYSHEGSFLSQGPSRLNVGKYLLQKKVLEKQTTKPKFSMFITEAISVLLGLQSVSRLYPWLGRRLQYLQCISSEAITVFYQGINIIFILFFLEIPSLKRCPPPHQGLYKWEVMPTYLIDFSWKGFLNL